MTQKWITLSISFVILACEAFLATASLGPTMEEAIQRLTGGGSKEWVLKRFVTILGHEDACKEGEIWRFQREGQGESVSALRERPRKRRRFGNFGKQEIST